MTTDPQTDRRERYAAPLYALMRQNGWDGERTEPVVREMDLVLDAVLSVADAEQAELRRMADEEQPEKPDRCPHGCDTSTRPCLACEADEEQQPETVPGTVSLTRNQLAALLAHHADVLAANLRTDARTGLPDHRTGVDRAAGLLGLHAERLTADEETPAVAELLDSILTFPGDARAAVAQPVKEA